MPNLQIDTFDAPRAKSDFVDDTMRIVFRDSTRADRARRQTIAKVQECETPQEVRDYIKAESLLIDALFLFDPDMAASIEEAAQDQIAWTNPRNRDPRPAEPGNTRATAQVNKAKGQTMFDIDTGGGSQGPWIQWQVLPSRDGQIPGKSFYIRDADRKEVFHGFDKGVVLDVQNIKVGWQHSEGVKGRAPDWKWWPAPNQRIDKPGDDWKWGISLPCAIGGGQTATWEQAGAAVQNAIKELTPALQQGPGDGSLPMVRLKDVRSMSFGAGTSEVPILEVVKWVPRPDCLKEGSAAAVAAAVTENTPEPPAQRPAEVDEDVAF